MSIVKGMKQPKLWPEIVTDGKLLFLGCFWDLINVNIKRCVNEFKDIERVASCSDRNDSVWDESPWRALILCLLFDHLVFDCLRCSNEWQRSKQLKFIGSSLNCFVVTLRVVLQSYLTYALSILIVSPSPISISRRYNILAEWCWSQPFPDFYKYW